MEKKAFLQKVEEKLAEAGLKTININEYEFLFPYKEEDGDKAHRDILGAVVFQGKRYYSLIEDAQMQSVINLLAEKGFEIEMA